jgi:hypothetical protein
VKKQPPEETPIRHIGRNPWFLAGCLLLSAVLCWLAARLLIGSEPLGFLLMVPAVFLSFQTLWLILNPFATFFANRLEIRQSLFHFRQTFYRDIKQVGENGRGQLYIVYNDDEIEMIGLFGVKGSERAPLAELFREQVALNMGVRD